MPQAGAAGKFSSNTAKPLNPCPIATCSLILLILYPNPLDLIMETSAEWILNFAVFLLVYNFSHIKIGQVLNQDQWNIYVTLFWCLRDVWRLRANRYIENWTFFCINWLLFVLCIGLVYVLHLCVILILVESCKSSSSSTVRWSSEKWALEL